MKRILKNEPLSKKAREALDFLLGIPEEDRMVIKNDLEYLRNFRMGFNSFMEEQIEQTGMSFGKTVENISGTETVRIMPPEIQDKLTVKVIYVHGGCFAFGDSKTYCSIPIQLAALGGFEVISVNYSLSPEAVFPEAVDEITGVYRSLLESGDTPDRIFFAGDSAGGNLVCASILRMKDLGIPVPAGAVLFSPWVDLNEFPNEDVFLEINGKKTLLDPVVPAENLRVSIDMYLKGENTVNPHISPVYGDFGGFPPVHITVGHRELLLKDSLELAERLDEYGCDVTLLEYENMWHVFTADSTLPEARESIFHVIGFIKDKMIQ